KCTECSSNHFVDPPSQPSEGEQPLRLRMRIAQKVALERSVAQRATTASVAKAGRGSSAHHLSHCHLCDAPIRPRVMSPPGGTSCRPPFAPYCRFHRLAVGRGGA